MTRRQVGRCLALAGTGVLLPAAAWAHPGHAPEPHDLWTAWTFAPAVIAGLALSAWLYARGIRALWRRAGRHRVVGPWRAAAFGGALVAVALALVSPVDAVANALFSVHMVQHLLLIMVAAPLAVAGDPALVMLWALPIGWRRTIARRWRRMVRTRAVWHAARLAPVAWTLHVIALWTWHAPALYELALRHEPVHVVEHATFFLTALLFWWLPLEPHGRRLGDAASILYLFAAALQSTILGALITFARHPWYASHSGTTRPWGLDPLQDQQLAGLLMWIPAGTVYLVVLLPLAWRMLADPVARSPRRYGASAAPLPAAGVSARGTP